MSRKVITWLTDGQPTDNEMVTEEGFLRALAPRMSFVMEGDGACICEDSFRPGTIALALDESWLEGLPRKGKSTPDLELDSYVVIVRFEEPDPSIAEAFVISEADLDLWVEDMDAHNSPLWLDVDDPDVEGDLYSNLRDTDYPIGIRDVHGWVSEATEDTLVAVIYHAELPAPKTTY